MRRLISTLLLSLFLVSGNIVFADRHDRKGHDKGRIEHRIDRNKHHDKKNDRDHNKRHDNHGRFDGHDRYSPKHNYREPKHNIRPQVRYHRPAPDRELRRMVAYAARGGRDVRVWRIDEDTFIVKYLLGGRYYTQRLYPFSGRYGSRGVVNINWNPLSSWTLLPSINISLPIN